MTLSRNLIAGLVNSVWSALIALAVVPFYIKYLGIEAYGLVGFYLTSQTLLQLLDMGMASTINREVARAGASGNMREARSLLHSLSTIYWGIAILIAILILIFAPLIANFWLQAKTLEPQTVSRSVMLIGVVLACRWPIGLYQGALIGAQRLAVSSMINMMMVSFANLGAIFVLSYLSSTIQAFFIWQACVGFVYAITMHVTTWHIIGREGSLNFEVACIRRVLKFSLGVGSISVCGLLLGQVDKIILSSTVSLDDFGKYMMANMVASSLYIIVIPVFNTIYPRFSSLVAQGKMNELKYRYRQATQWISIVLFPAAMILSLLAKPLIETWAGDTSIASDVAPLASILFWAYALHGIMHVPYALMLSRGETAPMLKIYGALIAIIAPVTFLISVYFGVLGGALAQFLLFISYMFIGIWVTHRRCYTGYASVWLTKDVGVFLAVSLSVGSCGIFIMQMLSDQIYVLLPVGGGIWFLALLLSICSSKNARADCIRYWNRIFLSGES
ncbi:oligosaccharide flippase family protein [Thalassospira sp.]|uniref:lipopolysaccharide biosynthesis protein n=1 Tax=Thalassospira sp. TaxID=1912094 RepID=UPI0025EEF6BA|nr:oligosaccharide flippase family protein [Thalassospira sp.]